MLLYRWKEKVYTTGEGAEDFQEATVRLYKAILEYEARLVCHLSRHATQRYIRAVVKSDDWKNMMDDISILESKCSDLTSAIDTYRASSSQNQTLRMTDAILNLQEEYQAERRTALQNQNLRSLFLTYEADKNRNPSRVPGTCQWFLNHVDFFTWREKQAPALLWVSADPGCGKSVLSKYLVDYGREILSSGVDPPKICYFFFKDGDLNRRSGSKALCAVLHQLFIQNWDLFSHAEQDFKQKGEKFLSDFDALWEILAKAAADPNAGEIICVLDALDECEELARNQLIDKLVYYYSNDEVQKSRVSRLKFIVTSRPYPDIELRFFKLTEASSSIRLVGEDESEQIGKEIDLVIETRIPEITYKLGEVTKKF
jgi:hypothetical protein